MASAVGRGDLTLIEHVYSSSNCAVYRATHNRTGKQYAVKQRTSPELGRLGTESHEEVVLNLGQAFDVTVKRRQTDYRQVNTPEGQLSEATSSWEVTVKNGKKEPVDVRVVETMQGDWSVTAESLPQIRQVEAIYAQTEQALRAMRAEMSGYSA